jgi:hypothetical protein
MGLLAASLDGQAPNRDPEANSSVRARGDCTANNMP